MLNVECECCTLPRKTNNMKIVDFELRQFSKVVKRGKNGEC
jgi:hypothetical protein